MSHFFPKTSFVWLLFKWAVIQCMLGNRAPLFISWPSQGYHHLTGWILSSSTGLTEVLLPWSCAWLQALYKRIEVMSLKKTRTTFETPKYARRPRDQYTARIVNTLELSAPHQIELKKNLSNLVISLVKFQTTNTCTYVAAKNGCTVKQSHFETV